MPIFWLVQEMNSFGSHENVLFIVSVVTDANLLISIRNLRNYGITVEIGEEIFKLYLLLLSTIFWTTSEIVYDSSLGSHDSLISEFGL